MASEIVSTARPTGLRLLGFLTLVAGAVLVGVGATMTWATVSFPGSGPSAVVKGVDVWEGVVVLVATAMVLVGLIVMRVVVSTAVRLGIAIGLAVAGVLVAAVAAFDLATAARRFGGRADFDLISRKIAAAVGAPVEQVRAALERNFASSLRVEVGPGIWMTIGGGALLVLAGALSFAWARSRAGFAIERTDEAGADETGVPAAGPGDRADEPADPASDPI